MRLLNINFKSGSFLVGIRSWKVSPLQSPLTTEHDFVPKCMETKLVYCWGLPLCYWFHVEMMSLHRFHPVARTREHC